MLDYLYNQEFKFSRIDLKAAYFGLYFRYLQREVVRCFITMALNVSKVVPRSPILAKRVNASRSQRVLLAFSPRKGSSSAEELQGGLSCTKPVTFVTSRRSSSTLCFLGKSQDTETKPQEDCLDSPK